MKEIPLTQGKIALVDDEDYERLSQFKWNAANLRGHFYAVRTVRISPNKRKNIFLHHAIMGSPPAGLESDHINGNRMDNRKENLRFVTRRQNCQNRHHGKKSSQYPGVHWHTSNKRWCSNILIDDKQIQIGSFSNEEAAFFAYKRAVEGIGERVIA